MANTIKAETKRKISNAKTVISFEKPAPVWATRMFRIVFLLTTAATIIIASDDSIAGDLEAKYTLYMKAFDFVIWGIARSIGVEKESFEK